MNTLVLKNYLKEGLSLTERMSSRNTTLPILSDVLIIAEKNRLILKATNLEIGVEIEMPAKVENTGTVAVSAQTIYSFISNLHTDEYLRLEKKDDNLLIKTPNTSTIIKGQTTEDFPSFPEIESKEEITIPSQDFFYGLKSVWYAASLSQIKPELSSIFISIKNKEICFVATDSFRLAEKKINYSGQNIKNILIPYKSAVEIIRILDNRTGNINISFDKNQLVLVIGEIKFITRLVDGVFPDYEQIMPKKILSDVSLDKQSFLNILKSAAIFVNKLQELQISTNSKNSILIFEVFGVCLQKLPQT